MQLINQEQNQQQDVLHWIALVLKELRWGQAETKGNRFGSTWQFLSDKGFPPQVKGLQYAHQSKLLWCAEIKVLQAESIQTWHRKEAETPHHSQIQEHRHIAHWHGLSYNPADTLADVPRAFPSFWDCSVKCRCCLWAPVIALASLFEGVCWLGALVLMQYSCRKNSAGSLRSG